MSSSTAGPRPPQSLARWLRSLGMGALILALALIPAVSRAQQDRMQDRLRYRLEAARPDAFEVAATPLMAQAGLRRLYQQRDYRPAWPDRTPQLETLLRWIDLAEAHGLNPHDYHRAALNVQPNAAGLDPVGQQLDHELLLSDAALMLSTHLLAGKVNPRSIDAEWHADMRGGDVVALLASALESNTLDQHFETLLPRAPGYQRLLKVLTQLRQGLSWPVPAAIPPGPALKLGHVGPRVALLRARLLPESGNVDTFDGELEKALRDFQQAVGLQADGILGPQSLALLNQTDADLVDLVRANLERWRWLPEALGARHILVNIPDFSLSARNDGVTELSMPIIVGRDYRRTPVFSANMRHVVLNPYWEVPHSIASQDLIPKFRDKPESFHALGYELFRGWGAQQQAITPRPGDWMQYKPTSFPYRLRQRPGPANAMGKIKFMMPNSFSVYLHDTAQPELFAKSVRTLSSGCIRLSQPQALLKWVTQGRTPWPESWQPADQTVRLNSPVPVHIQYWTAWADSTGELRRRYDVYQRDAAVIAALAASPGGS